MTSTIPEVYIWAVDKIEQPQNYLCGRAGVENAKQGVKDGVDSVKDGAETAKQDAKSELESGKAEAESAKQKAKSGLESGKAEVRTTCQ